MTLKNSSFNAGLLRETLRRNIWAVTLAVLGFAFTLPLPVAMSVQTINNRDYAVPMIKHLEMKEKIQGFIGLQSPLAKVVMIVLAVVCAVAIFSYLHSRQRTDFYHSLPVSRGKLFACNYAAGAVIVLPCYIVMQLVAYLIALASGCGDAVAASQPLVTIGANLIFFFAVYALAVACTVLCGNTIVTLLLFGWSAFSLSAAVMLWETLCMTFYQTYTDLAGFSSNLMMRLSPVIQYLFLIPYQYQGKAMYATTGDTSVWLLLLAYLAVAVLLTALAFFLFKRRKSECAGMAIAFNGLRAPLKFWCCTVMAVGVGWIFYNIVDNSKLWLFFGFLAGGVLTHFLMEIIYSFDFKAIFRHWKSLLVYGAVFAVCIACMAFDITGYDRYLPAAGDLQAVGVEYRGYEGDGGGGAWQPATSEYADLTDPENIDAVLSLARKGVDSLGTEPDRTVRLTVNYLKKGGGEASRTYVIPHDEADDRLFDQIRFSEEYITKRAPAFTYALTGRDEVDVYTSLQPYTSYNNANAAASNSNQDEVEVILEALRKDMLQFTPEQARTEAPVLRLVFLNLTTREEELAIRNGMEAMTGYGDGYTIRSTSQDIAVYPSYKETLACIERYTGVTPVRLTPDNVISAELHLYNHEDDTTYSGQMRYQDKNAGEETANVTDRADLEALLQDAVTDAELSSADVMFNADAYVLGEKGFEIIAQFKNGQGTHLYYPEGKAPEQVFAKYFPQQ